MKKQDINADDLYFIPSGETVGDMQADPVPWIVTYPDGVRVVDIDEEFKKSVDIWGAIARANE